MVLGRDTKIFESGCFLSQVPQSLFELPRAARHPGVPATIVAAVISFVFHARARVRLANGSSSPPWGGSWSSHCGNSDKKRGLPSPGVYFFPLSEPRERLLVSATSDLKVIDRKKE